MLFLSIYTACVLCTKGTCIIIIVDYATGGSTDGYIHYNIHTLKITKHTELK